MNNTITAFLNYYVELETAPNYAVLLKGTWGSGKSWYIKNYISLKKQNKSIRLLYVSLYGINSFEDIEQAFIKELHPILASDGMKLAKAIFKGVMKTTIKVDLDINNNSSNDMTVTTGAIPDVALLKSIKENKDCILIFDDVERCPIPLTSLLGYINQLVENEDIKAILIANEDEIDAKAESSTAGKNSYRVIKEKLIGKTFEIKTDINEAINSFINQLSNEKAKSFLIERTDKLIDCFNLSTYNNLRHLRHGILDFESFYDYLPQSSLEKKELIDIIVQAFFAINFELKKGFITEKDIEKITNNYYLINRKKEDKEDAVITMFNKYRSFGRENPISSQVWSSFFSDFYIDKQVIESQILNSIYYKENTPNWVTLSHFTLLSENEFIEIYKSVYRDFVNLAYDTKEAVAYSTSLLMFFSWKGIIPEHIDTIYELSLNNINNLKELGKLDLKFNQQFYLDMDRLSSINNENIDKFNQFFSKLKLASESTKNKSIETEAGILLETMTTSMDEVYDRLVINATGRSDLYNIPVLNYIDKDDFMDLFLQITPSERNELGRLIYKRYEYPEYNKRLLPELDWLKSIYGNLKHWANMQNTEETKLTRYLMQTYFLPKVKAAMDKLEESIE